MRYLLIVNTNQCGVPPETINKIQNGEQFLDVLEECCLLSERNVLYLQFLLHKVTQQGHHCFDLCEEVRIYAEKYKEDFNTLYFQPVHKSKGKTRTYSVTYFPFTICTPGRDVIFIFSENLKKCKNCNILYP